MATSRTASLPTGAPPTGPTYLDSKPAKSFKNSLDTAAPPWAELLPFNCAAESLIPGTTYKPGALMMA